MSVVSVTEERASISVRTRSHSCEIRKKSLAQTAFRAVSAERLLAALEEIRDRNVRRGTWVVLSRQHLPMVIFNVA